MSVCGVLESVGLNAMMTAFRQEKSELKEGRGPRKLWKDRYKRQRRWHRVAGIHSSKYLPYAGLGWGIGLTRATPSPDPC
jgi:hypothetical protein